MNSPVFIKDKVSMKTVPVSPERIADLQKLIRRNRFLPVPSQEDIFVGDGDYLAIGTEFLGHFIELGGLRENERVLDIGCGIGRMAVPLTQYLDPETAQYAGIDPASSGINWCTRNIGSVYPNFRFTHLDIANGLYNPGGHIRGTDISLPFANGSFDFAIMTSVVTHLPPQEIRPYFKEVSRLLDLGGRLFLSAFVMDKQPERKDGQPPPRIVFQRAGNSPAWCADLRTPLSAVAFDDGFLDEALKVNGFEITLKRLGHWRGGTESRNYQDFFVAVKTARGSD
ncbi:class I SAM-dependent methyltransferase [Roseibium aggregatum]|uniref:Class I SAM-dependent methyltransferase n=1 Tax=Roseibium aggregatum TaxID=187304 RepID=A0A939EGW7_9HYPH|nr:class I SAM-dependent methyltransferase [Roseibium aggregatum]MBN9672247.1 class I SAM-dependent methyltransferase [Roseibium aggregatum]